MRSKLSVRDLAVEGKRVLVRVDFNVPLDKNARITDDSRIRASLPTIRYLVERGARVVLISHLGRPRGERVEKLSLSPCRERLSQLLGCSILMAGDCVGEEAQRVVDQLQPGEVTLLENLRFHSAEEDPSKDPSFAGDLAALGECYVNDAFGTAHRAHSSTAVIAKFFSDCSAMGFLMEKEVSFLGRVLFDPVRPFHALIGGAKISTKIGVLKALVEKVDELYIGGAMSFTFLKSLGLKVGASLVEESYLFLAKEIIDLAVQKGVKLHLPVDLVAAERIDSSAQSLNVDVEEGVPEGWLGVDIGAATVKNFCSSLQRARTVFWNGPLGVFEIAPFAVGTNSVARGLSAIDGEVIVGGGDSVSAIVHLGLEKEISHLSTGGGASLEFIEQGSLPGIEALSESVERKRV